MKPTHLIVGLGNPEGKYFQTWHNLGFLCVEQITPDFKKKGNQLLGEYEKSLILKPLTYMNLSGQAVIAASRKHKIAPENIIVILDDVNIEIGNIRIAFGGSSGGHNGLKSITNLLGTDKYLRVRIGCKPEKEPHNMADYVLAKIPKELRTQIDEAIDKAKTAAVELASGEKLEIIQGRYNTKNAKNN